MIVMQCGAHLPQLNISCGFHLALPDAACQGGASLPYVVCLHDEAQNGAQLLTALGLDALVDERRVALLLPDGQNSCFLNMAHGPSWQTYLLDGLIPFAQRTFPLRSRPFLLGLGTGGWAASRLAAQYADHFAGCIAVQARADLPLAYTRGELAASPDWEAAFGDPDSLPDFPLSPDTLWLHQITQVNEALCGLLGADGSATA